MKQWMGVAAAAVFAVASAIVVASPTVFPTGTTIYDPAKTWSGFTVLSPLGGAGAVIIDMNGHVLKQWDDVNSSAGGPARVLPGGYLIGATGARPGRQESLALASHDFDGKVLWTLDHNEQIEIPKGGGAGAAKGNGGPGAFKGKGGAKGKGAAKGPQEMETVWSIRQHHDWQRTDFPAGYFSPGVNPSPQPGKTLLLTHINRVQDKVTPGVTLEDDRLLEVDGTGKVLWEWVISDHVDELHFDAAARKTLAEVKGNNFNWAHLNSATYVGPNHWFDSGDQRFNPDNVIISSREASIVAIVARDGKIVWQLGPDYTKSPEMSEIRQVIGQHNAHFIPKGLPGAGNVMIFDNGGPSGYGAPTPTATNGKNIYSRTSSRILEIDPVSLKLVWSYTAGNFFATNISGAQRLPNGNTLITEGPSGRIFEVTNGGEIVWEYLYPATGNAAAKGRTASVYRAYRVPYAWVPQLAKPTEKAVTPPGAAEFQVP